MTTTDVSKKIRTRKAYDGLAECFVNNESLSKYMVRNGYAFASRLYSNKFVQDEDYAKENNLGTIEKSSIFLIINMLTKID